MNSDRALTHKTERRYLEINPTEDGPRITEFSETLSHIPVDYPTLSTNKVEDFIGRFVQQFST